MMQMIVCILKNYGLPGRQNRLNFPKNHPGIMRQTPGSKGLWGDVQFTVKPVKKCDYVIVLNHPSQDTTVQCPEGHIWAVIQEPPADELRKKINKGDVTFNRIYTSTSYSLVA